MNELKVRYFVGLSDLQRLPGHSGAEGVCAFWAGLLWSPPTAPSSPLGSTRAELVWLWVRSMKVWHRTRGRVFHKWKITPRTLPNRRSEIAAVLPHPMSAQLAAGGAFYGRIQVKRRF